MKLRKISNNKKSKKGVTVVVGYVLLITFSVVLGLITYKLLKTYVPKPEISCPDGTSILIESYSYDCNSKKLVLNMVNNGKFDIGAYFIYGANSSEREKGNIELSSMNIEDTSKLAPNGIKFGSFIEKNSLAPNDRETETYNLTKLNGELELVEILPIRWQTEDKKSVLVSCKNAEIKKEIQCNP
jgi:hypothetical protein